MLSFVWFSFFNQSKNNAVFEDSTCEGKQNAVLSKRPSFLSLLYIVIVDFSEDYFKNRDLYKKTTFIQEKMHLCHFIPQQSFRTNEAKNLRTVSLDPKVTGSYKKSVKQHLSNSLPRNIATTESKKFDNYWS